MRKKATIRKGENYAPQRGVKTSGKQEGWNCGTRNYFAQKDIDQRRAARKKKFRKKGKSAHKWGDYVRYKGVY